MKIKLILLLFLCSCSHKIVLSTRTCKGAGILSRSQGVLDFNFRAKVSSYLEDESIYLEDILGAANIRCHNIETLEVLVERTPADFFWSFLPFYERISIGLRGNFKSRSYFDEDI